MKNNQLKQIRGHSVIGRTFSGSMGVGGYTARIYEVMRKSCLVLFL